MLAVINRLSLTLVTLAAIAAVVFLALADKIADGETVTTLSAVMLGYVGGHAIQKLPNVPGVQPQAPDTTTTSVNE